MSQLVPDRVVDPHHVVDSGVPAETVLSSAPGVRPARQLNDHALPHPLHRVTVPDAHVPVDPRVHPVYQLPPSHVSLHGLPPTPSAVNVASRPPAPPLHPLHERRTGDVLHQVSDLLTSHSPPTHPLLAPRWGSAAVVYPTSTVVTDPSPSATPSSPTVSPEDDTDDDDVPLHPSSIPVPHPHSHTHTSVSASPPRPPTVPPEVVEADPCYRVESTRVRAGQEEV